jgi:hypothetical protein
LEAEGQGAKSVESFQRKLLQARLEYEQRVPSNQTPAGTKPKESFQRKLLQARLKYEQRVPYNQTQAITEEEERNGIIEIVTPLEERNGNFEKATLLEEGEKNEDALLSRKKPKKKKTRSTQGFGAPDN